MHASALVAGGFVILPIVVSAMFVLGCEWAARRLGEPEPVRRRHTMLLTIATIGWLVLTAGVAATGVLRRFDWVPPPFAGLLISIPLVGIVVSFSRLGTLLVRGLPLAALVGSQVFRFPLELVMHRAHVEEVMPVQMSFAGYNYDILTGITAGLLAIWLTAGRVPRWVVAVWNVAGLALLVNVVTIAIVSTPLFRWFGDEQLNVFVTYAPYVWLPAVLVTAALIGHLLVSRALSAR